MKYIAGLLLFFYTFTNAISQYLEVDGFDFKFKKVLRNSRKFEAHTGQYFIKVPKGQKKYNFDTVLSC